MENQIPYQLFRLQMMRSDWIALSKPQISLGKWNFAYQFRFFLFPIKSSFNSIVELFFIQLAVGSFLNQCIRDEIIIQNEWFRKNYHSKMRNIKRGVISIALPFGFHTKIIVNRVKEDCLQKNVDPCSSSQDNACSSVV